eukprot:213613-Ditylum_brightwellii.AAC.1
MKFGLDKCAVLTTKQGITQTSNLLPEIPQLDEEKGAHYLGIYKGVDFLMDSVKNNAKKEYFHQNHSILKVDLLGNYTMTEIFACAVSAMYCTFGIIHLIQA